MAYDTGVNPYGQLNALAPNYLPALQGPDQIMQNAATLANMADQRLVMQQQLAQGQYTLQHEQALSGAAKNVDFSSMLSPQGQQQPQQGQVQPAVNQNGQIPMAGGQGQSQQMQPGYYGTTMAGPPNPAIRQQQINLADQQQMIAQGVNPYTAQQLSPMQQLQIKWGQPFQQVLQQDAQQAQAQQQMPQPIANANGQIPMTQGQQGQSPVQAQPQNVIRQILPQLLNAYVKAGATPQDLQAFGTAFGKFGMGELNEAKADVEPTIGSKNEAEANKYNAQGEDLTQKAGTEQQTADAKTLTAQAAMYKATHPQPAYGVTPTDSGAIASVAQDLVSGKIAPTQLPLYFPNTRGGQQARLLANEAAEKIDPDYDGAQLEQNYKTFTSSSWRNANTAVQTFLPNIDRMAGLINSLPNGPITSLNSAIQAAGIQVGNIPVTDLASLKAVMATEYSKSLGGTGQTTDTAYKEAINAFASTSSLPAFRSVVNQMRALEYSRLTSNALTAGPYGKNYLATQLGADRANSLIAEHNNRVNKGADIVLGKNLMSGAAPDEQTLYAFANQHSDPKDPDYQTALKCSAALKEDGLIQ